MTLEDTLKERGKTHGNFTENSVISQSIKLAMHDSKNWDMLDDHQIEALEMIAHKIGRILAGNPNLVDHWHDISGYAKLVEDTLQPKKDVVE